MFLCPGFTLSEFLNPLNDVSEMRASTNLADFTFNRKLGSWGKLVFDPCSKIGPGYLKSMINYSRGTYKYEIGLKNTSRMLYNEVNRVMSGMFGIYYAI